MGWILGILGIVVGVAIYDLTQRRHSILRNFPLVGHFRYWLESIGPELRQYIVTDNDEERPFSRDQRRWVYSSAKKENTYFGFGTDNELELSPHYLIIKHSAFPKHHPLPGDAGYNADHPLACGKVLGQARGRKGAFRPSSIVNISAMSYGSLSAPAVEALNRGAGLSQCLHNTGEGGISEYHRSGGELIYQMGTGYFGCRDAEGNFSEEKLVELVAQNPVRAIEVKLSQGAKPGVGGILPGAKVTPEIAAIRGIPLGKDCKSPNRHREFSDVDSMLDFVERIAEATGVPVGIKSAVGDQTFWDELAAAMESGSRGVDFIAVDGGEGGTGAGPLVFSDHVALPVFLGLSRVYSTFARRGLHEKVVFQAAGKLGFPERALMAFGLGADMVYVAREAMLAIGCIQAQRCHTGHCPAGVATQNRWLMRGLDPTDKAARTANYIVNLRKEVAALCHACGVDHPAFITKDHFEILDDRFGASPLAQLFAYEDGWGVPSAADQKALLA